MPITIVEQEFDATLNAVAFKKPADIDNFITTTTRMLLTLSDAKKISGNPYAAIAHSLKELILCRPELAEFLIQQINSYSKMSLKEKYRCITPFKKIELSKSTLSPKSLTLLVEPFNPPAATERVHTFLSTIRASNQELSNSRIPEFIKRLATRMGLRAATLNFYFLRKSISPHYNTIWDLRCYLTNKVRNKTPALSLEEALATTLQEQKNLATAYSFIEEGFLTIETASRLTETERRQLLQIHPQNKDEIRNYVTNLAARHPQPGA